MNQRIKNISQSSVVLCILIFVGGPWALSETGTQPFQFDPKAVSEITWTQWEPSTGNRWIAQLSKTIPEKLENGRKNLKGRSSAPSKNQSNQSNQSKNPWKITAAPDGVQLMDRIADETLIFHLLDSLKTLKIDSEAPKGPLPSFQLDPPRVAIQWKTSDHQYELRLGQSLKTKQTYISLDGTHVWIASGVAFRLLDLVQSFDGLRQKVWTPLTSDEVDEVEIDLPKPLNKKSPGTLTPISTRKSKKITPPFYAQREGDRWTNRTNQLFTKSFDSDLNQIVASKAIGFVDSKKEAAELDRIIRSPSAYHLTVRDRKGKATQLHFMRHGKTLVGTSSARPGSFYVLRPELVQVLEAMEKTPVRRHLSKSRISVTES